MCLFLPFIDVIFNYCLSIADKGPTDSVYNPASTTTADIKAAFYVDPKKDATDTHISYAEDLKSGESVSLVIGTVDPATHPAVLVPGHSYKVKVGVTATGYGDSATDYDFDVVVEYNFLVYNKSGCSEYVWNSVNLAFILCELLTLVSHHPSHRHVLQAV